MTRILFVVLLSFLGLQALVSAQDKAPGPIQPKEGGEAPLDPALKAVLPKESGKYADAGFKKYVFGTGKKEIEKLTTLEGILKPHSSVDGWLLDWGLAGTRMTYESNKWFRNKEKKELFCIVDDRLVGVTKAYHGDNKAYLAAAIDLFGKTDKSNVLAFRDVQDLGRDARSHSDMLCAYFSFPKSVAAISVTTHRLLNPPRTLKVGQDQDCVEVCVIDRDYFLRVANGHIKRTRQVFEFCRKTTELGEKDKTLPLEKLRAFGADNMEVKVIDEKGIPEKYRQVHVTNKGSARQFLLGRVLVERAGELVAHTEFDIRFEDISVVPDEYNTIRRSLFDELLLNATIGLAQGYYPPKGKVIARKAVREFGLVCQWDTADGWHVDVRNHSIYVFKQVKAKKVLD